MNRPAWEMMPGGALQWTGDEYIAEVRQKDGEWCWSVWHVWSDRVPDPDPRSSGARETRDGAQRAAFGRIEALCFYTLGQMGWEGEVSRDVESGAQEVRGRKGGAL